jgi:hypothetical protein
MFSYPRHPFMRIQACENRRIPRSLLPEYGGPIYFDQSCSGQAAKRQETRRARIMDRRATLARPTEAGAKVLQSELLWIVHTVALAILNPSKIRF